MIKINKMNMKMNKMNTSMEMKKCNDISKYIRKYSTYTNKTWEIEELNFDFSTFYKKHEVYLPNNLSPSSNFLSWFIGFTEGEGSFIVNNRGDLAFVVVQSRSDIRILHYI